LILHHATGHVFCVISFERLSIVWRQRDAFLRFVNFRVSPLAAYAFSAIKSAPPRAETNAVFIAIATKCTYWLKQSFVLFCAMLCGVVDFSFCPYSVMYRKRIFFF
jgi:hypothetical protein